MKLEYRKVGDVIVVKPLIQGLNSRSGTQFKSQLFELVERGASLVVIDLSHVRAVDASGLNIMLSISKSTGKKDTVVFSNVCPDLKALLYLTKLFRTFRMFVSSNEAVRAISALNPGVSIERPVIDTSSTVARIRMVAS